MTVKQKRVFAKTIDELLPIEEFHHGDYIGADCDAHVIINTKFDIPIFIHPPNNNSLRAYCKQAKKLFKKKPYLESNKDIVDACDLLIACPKEHNIAIGDGTWFTVEYAKNNKKLIYLIYPNGKREEI